MGTLRTSLIRLAHQNPSLRPHLLPILKTARNSFEFSLSVAVNHDMADAVRMDRGGFTESYVELVQYSHHLIKNFLNGERVGRSVLKVKRIETQRQKLTLLIEASPPPATEDEEAVLYGAEGLLKTVLREEFNRDGGEWLYLDVSDISVEVL
jgi:hypothetical protein